MNSQINRRSFIRNSIFTAAALSIPARSWGQVRGANGDIRIAIVGFNGQGKSHIETFRKIAGVRVVALCDVDKEVLEREASKFRERGEPIDTYTDVRKLLDSGTIDAISTATPNHWHALISIWACQAGKDVYVEKPVSHNVWEGRQIVNAARKYKRIVQTGTQSRSSHGIKEAVAWVNQGNLGKIIVSRGLCYKPRASIGKVSAPQAPPSSVDYDLWCGPAPKTPLMRSKLHYDWHWVWPSGNGDLGNQGIHQMDIARWFLGEKELSPRVFSVGGRLGYIDDGTTPNTQVIVHHYAKAPLIFEVRGLPKDKASQAPTLWKGENMDKYKGGTIAVVVECEGGYILVPDYNKSIAYDKAGKEIKRFEGSSSHHANFIDAVRSRKISDLNADILEGHLSSALCHTGNISYRLGKQSNPDKIRKQIKSDKQAQETYERFREHLTANGVDLRSSKATIGPVLTMDPATERFKGNSAANALLTREYRSPFIVPAKV